MNSIIPDINISNVIPNCSEIYPDNIPVSDDIPHVKVCIDITFPLMLSGTEVCIIVVIADSDAAARENNTANKLNPVKRILRLSKLERSLRGEKKTFHD